MASAKQHFTRIILFGLFTGFLFSPAVFAAGAPHSLQNSIECGSCHWTHTGGGGTLFPD